MLKLSSLLLFAFVSINPVQTPDDWQLKTNKNGITVYTKSIPEISADAVKSVCTMSSSLSGLVALVSDISSYDKWVFHCAHAEILKTISSSEIIYYQETSVPWPASNRDFVGKMKISQDIKTGIVTVKIENMPGYIPENSGIVRLKTFNETITIVPKGNGKAELSYEMEMDAGGNIPGWMVNLAITSGPYESISELVKLVNTGAYRSARFPFIREF